MSGSSLGSHGFTGSCGVALLVFVREDENPSLQSLVLPFLLYGCETSPLTRHLRWRFNSFGTRSLRRIVGYG